MRKGVARLVSLDDIKKLDPAREGRKLLARIAAVQTNAGPYVSDNVLDRLIGAEHALAITTGMSKTSYLNLWLDQAEANIRKAHARLRTTPCGCGVCKQ